MNTNYKKICSDLLVGLPDKMKDVLERRFGIGKAKEMETLQSIGDDYDITRERVRQLEYAGLEKTRQKARVKAKNIFNFFFRHLKNSGDLRKEEPLLEQLGGRDFRNYVFFLLALSDQFKRFNETEDFYSLWTINPATVETAKGLINFLISELKEKKQPLCLGPNCLPADFRVGKTQLISYLEISKTILKSPEGLYGLRDWPEIYPRSIKDKSYLVLKKANKPLHFSEISSGAEKLNFYLARASFDAQAPALIKKVNIQTVHNELIKDQRFVLVGRGMYALKEWGYEPGVVKDIILKIMKKTNQPLKKEEIAEKVLLQRKVKKNTIFQNLQNKNYFIRDSLGNYFIKEA